MKGVMAPTLDKDTDLLRCQELAESHYENFAIGSRLLPRQSRDALAAIYAVVRIADDLADEDRPGVTPEQRIAEIQDWQAGLEAAVNGEGAPHWAQRAGAQAITQHNLDMDCFRALFRAFIRDAEGANYESFDDLLGYCADSANPVGRLVIALLDPERANDPRLLDASDSICTGRGSPSSPESHDSQTAVPVQIPGARVAFTRE